MSTSKRPPLLSERLHDVIASLDGNVSEWVIDDLLAIHDEFEIYEAARAKDAERIEQLEALCRAMGNGLDEMMRPANRECDGAHCTGCWKDINGQLVKLLFAAGFKPSEP